jgi:thiamine-monophosphate kinase
MKTLADIGEDELIHRLVAGLKLDRSVIVGPGDDCAVVKAPAKAGERLLLKTDTVVEGVHFTTETPPKLIGRKAMARVISDFAAMAGTPCHALVTLIAPPQTPVKRVLAVYAGLREMAEAHGVNIVGGETSRGEQLILTVSLTGTVGEKSWIARSTAKAGDLLLVTGRLGGSIKGKHLRFEPRVAEARWLTENLPVRAMMDLSDGLAKDLPRLADASGLGFELWAPEIPITPGCTLEQALGDGEDYELLLAVSPKMKASMMHQWHCFSPKVPLTVIGQLLPLDGKSTNKLKGGWEHFR